MRYRTGGGRTADVPLFLRPSHAHSQVPELSQQCVVADSVRAPLGHMSFAICNRDCFRLHRPETISKRLPRMHHGFGYGAPRHRLHVRPPEVGDLRPLRSRQLRVDPRRDTVSLARVFGVKPITSAPPVDVVEHEDEFSFEPPDSIAGHCSNSLAASTGILKSLPPRRKARSLPLLIRLRTCFSLHCHSSASAAGV
jgi:hypothetical protein